MVLLRMEKGMELWKRVLLRRCFFPVNLLPVFPLVALEGNLRTWKML